MSDTPPLIFSDIADDFIASAKSRALEYALISKPFTFNRMQRSLSDCVVNIAKGKFVEDLFVSLCRGKGLVVDTDSCSTHFWQRDRRDFVLLDREWDIKSIFLHRAPPRDAFNDCPALIPNRYGTDQWATREHRYVPLASKAPAYVFVFVTPLECKIELDTQQEAFINGLCREYKEQAVNQKPFDRDWFIANFPRFNNLQLEVKSDPVIGITGFASTNEWELYDDQPVGPIFIGSTKIYHTAIRNKSCRSGDLPSFAKLVGWS